MFHYTIRALWRPDYGGPLMILITKSTLVADQLAAAHRPTGPLRLPIMLILTAITLVSIYLMAQGQHAAAALGFLCVIVAALALRLHDVGQSGPVDALAAGLAGEQAVTATLRALDDRYVLVNGLRFTQPQGELDHLLLGPHGLLGLETKAHDGHVVCLAGHWRRWAITPDGRVHDLRIGNPAAQLRRTLGLLERLLNRWGVTTAPSGAIVFTHPQVELELSDPPCPALRLDHLLTFVASLPQNAMSAEQVLDLADRVRAFEPPDTALERPPTMP